MVKILPSNGVLLQNPFFIRAEVNAVTYTGQKNCLLVRLIQRPHLKWESHLPKKIGLFASLAAL